MYLGFFNKKYFTRFWDGTLLKSIILNRMNSLKELPRKKSLIFNKRQKPSPTLFYNERQRKISHSHDNLRKLIIRPTGLDYMVIWAQSPR